MTKPEIEFQEGPAPTELVVKDITVGDGAEAVAGALVDVHYVGVEYDTGEEFDSSWSRGESIRFPLAGLIAGWQEGIPGMKVGGRRQLTIPPELAYGPAGSGHQLSGKTLVFIIDLLGVQVPPEPPVIEKPEGPAPTELVVEDIEIGDGAEAQPVPPSTCTTRASSSTRAKSSTRRGAEASRLHSRLPA